MSKISNKLQDWRNQLIYSCKLFERVTHTAKIKQYKATEIILIDRLGVYSLKKFSIDRLEL